MKESLKRMAIVREEFYALTNDYFVALVLNQFNLYQTWAKHVSDYIAQENARSQVPEDSEGYIKPTEGWFYKSADELCEELMHPFKKTKALDIIQTLVDRGWLLTRQNPANKWDRVKQYRVDLVKLNDALQELGYTLPLWDTGKLKLARNSNSATRNTIPPGGNVNSARRQAIPKESIGSEQREEPLTQQVGGLNSFSDSGPTSDEPKPGSSDLVIPSSTDPGFPKLPHGKADYITAVETYDPEGGRLFSELYPNFLWTPEAARQFIRKRRNGNLRMAQLRLLHACYKEHWQSWEEAQLDYKRPGDPHALLQTKNLSAAIAHAKSCARGELQSIESDAIGLSSVDDDTLRSCQSSAWQGILRTVMEDKPALTCAAVANLLRGVSTWSIVLGFYLGHFPEELTGLEEFREAKRDTLLAELIICPQIYDYIRRQNKDPEDVFGIPAAELNAAVAERQRPIDERKAKLQAMLTA